MTDAIEGEAGAYVPCDELASPFPDDPVGAIVGSGVGFVSKDMLASPMPADPVGAITGSGVGFVPKPCGCDPADPAHGVFLAYRRYIPTVDSPYNDPIPANIISTGGSITHWFIGGDSGLGCDGRGSEGTMQYTITGAVTGLRITIDVWVGLSSISNSSVHPRCFTNIPFQWELRRAHWGASFAPTYDDFQLDPNGSILGGGTVIPTAQICYPYPTYPAPTIAEERLHLFSYAADVTPDGDGKIQFQLRISDLDVDSAAQYNNYNNGSGFFPTGSELEDDQFLYSHTIVYSIVTVCALY